MNGEPLQRTVKIISPLGLHLRPAMALAARAADFQCDLTVLVGDKQANGKVWLELMMLTAEQGRELVLRAQGADAGPALEALSELLDSLFREEAAAPSPPGVNG